jgi:hypothetical protein
MFIRQSEEDIRQSLILNVNAAIDAIRLAEATLWSAPPEDLGTDLETEVKFRAANFRRKVESIIFVVDFKFTARCSNETTKPKDLIKVACKFEAEYHLKPEFDPTEAQIKAFHKGNVIFNCWPFFREFVQNSTVRMHMPPPPIPFLRMMPPDKTKQAKQLQSTTQS